MSTYRAPPHVCNETSKARGHVTAQRVFVIVLTKYVVEQSPKSYD